MNTKPIEPLIKKFAPPESVKKLFYDTMFGSLMGQTVVLLGLLAVYVAIVAALYAFAKQPLQAFRDDLGTPLFAAITLAPLASILLFAALPTGARALRERRLKRNAIAGVPKPGYFRLQPYGPADRDTFKRLDGADGEILNWIKVTPSSLLYLSGASGSGKSSLLAASVLPQLRDAGWAVAQTRLFGDPVERVRAAVLAAEDVFSRRPTNADKLPLADLLDKAAAARAKALPPPGASKAPPLLLVIDQFEEFLILHDEAARRPFADALHDLAGNPRAGLRLLLAFRSDYRPLIFKLGLPPLAPNDNWKELAPYGRTEATALLQVGGRELSPAALDALFRGLDRIEQARGLYRPITLNMIGLVLDDMDGTLRADPARLIQTYLTDSLTAGESRDFAKPLLEKMITDAGTKEPPRTEADLAAKTHFELWQVQATLADLARKALVRRLEAEPPRRLEGGQPSGVEEILPTPAIFEQGTWEIAHDFLARTIGQLIGRLKPTPLQRVRPLVAPAALAGWVVVLAAALPFWQLSHQRAAERVLRDSFGATLAAQEPQRILGLKFPDNFSDRKLTDAVPFLRRLDQISLDLNNTRITSLEPLKGLSNLRSLHLSGSRGMPSLDPLSGLTNLQFLSVSGSLFDDQDGGGLTRLEPIAGLANLSILVLTNNRGITSLEPLRGLTNLRSLLLIGSSGITSVEPLKSLTNLAFLNLGYNSGITSLVPIMTLTNLSTLDLSYNSGITSLEPLKGLTNLSTLNLGGTTGITSLEPLKGLTNLSSLNLSGDTGINSLEPLKDLTNLSTLNLSGTAGITSLEPLKDLTKLFHLDLSGASGITSLGALQGLTNLSYLDLSDASGITSLEPLRRMEVRINGASDALLATMR